MAKPPYLPALDKKYEEEPKTKCPLYHGIKPWDGIPYKVQDEDSFQRLADRAGVPVWTLIDYNFKTNKNPLHVNWYLRNFVGCKSTTWDNKNYSFDATADPGIIYFHHKDYERLIESGKKPTPFYSEDDDYVVTGTVPSYNQVLKDKTCWAVAAGMLISWKNPYLNSLKATLEWAEGDWLKKFERNESLNAIEMAAYISDVGIESVSNAPATPQEWADTMTARGPLMTIQPSKLGFIHWVVVTGYRVRVPTTLQMRYREPGNGSLRFMDYETFVDKVESGRSGGGWQSYYWARW